MSSFSDSKGGRIVMGIGAGIALGITVGPLLLWVPAGIVLGALWAKKAD